VEKALTQIETVVVLMLENRSLDNVLGWLYHEELPAHVFPRDSFEKFDGIPSWAANRSGERNYTPARGTNEFAEPMRVPRWDPHEGYEHVVQQLCADGDGVMSENPWDHEPRMDGFAHDFDAMYDDPREVMGAYDENQLPVLYGLARRFAVSDRWFASVPTQTNANRAFSICGTSLGVVNNSEVKTYDTRTIFDALTGTKSWGVYWQWDGFQSGDPGPPGGCYTADLFPHIRQAINRGEGQMSSYASFLDDLTNNREIPQFCYLEPHWSLGLGYPTGHDFVGVQGNDYHPPAFVGPAEYHLSVLYDALRTSPKWKNMLFVITFDEHGGTWDHVSPTRTVAPDEHVSRLSGEPEFDFTRLGVRVPTILVSPFVKPGTVFRAPKESEYDFDHTSLIATMLKWIGQDPATAGLGHRVGVAPTFESVLSDEGYFDTEHIAVPDEYKDQGGGLGLHFGLSLEDFNPTGLGVQIWRHLAEKSNSATEFIDHLRGEVTSAT
jgi:phospholipase C